MNDDQLTKRRAFEFAKAHQRAYYESYYPVRVLGGRPAEVVPAVDLPPPTELPPPSEWPPPSGWSLPSEWALPLFAFGSDGWTG